MFRRRRGRLAIAAGAIALIVLAATASGAHWSHAGGDVGHSGYQPIDETGPPVALLYEATDDSPIRTSILTSAGSIDQQRIIYSTSDGRVHHRGLDDGQPSFSTRLVLSPDFAPDTNVFGSGRGNVSPVESSSPDRLGFTYQIFNEDTPVTDPMGSDIALSIFRQSDGTLVDTVRIAGGTNYTVNQSPILFESALWFVATPDPNPQVPPQDPQATPKLFKVNLGDPSGTVGNPTVGSVKTVNVSGAQALASPTGLFLRDADGNPKPYVALAFNSGNTVRTFTADTVDPVAGPQSGDLPGGNAFTPSVPIQPNGRTPQPGNGNTVTTASYIYVATATTDPASNRAGTQVHKLIQPADNPAALSPPPDPESPRSAIVMGNPSLMLALSQEADEAATTSDGRVVLTTSCDVYTISVSDMTDVEALLGPNAPDACASATDSDPGAGFGRTTAALSGNLGFVQRNNGDQIAFDINTAEPLSGDQFRGEVEGATAAFGQPSISRRLIQFGDDKRLSVYRAEEQVPPGESGAEFSINDVTVTEGDAGAQAATFTISRGGSLGGTVTVATADNSAKAGEDYTAIGPQVISFTDGELSKTVTVPLNPDVFDEADETFFVRLSAPTGPGARIIDGEGLGLITDDDPSSGALRLAITDVTVSEGSTATFNVSLSGPSRATVSVDYATADDTAKAPRDYIAQRGALSFAPGETNKTVTVRVNNDRVEERVERFVVGLGNARNAGVSDPLGAALIIDVEADALKARGLSVRVTPRRDRRAPFQFVTTGRLLRPAGLTAREACRGRVSVQVKSIRTTVSSRRPRLRRTCRFRSAVTFKSARRLAESGRLRFIVRFLGNPDVQRTRPRVRVVRAG